MVSWRCNVFDRDSREGSKNGKNNTDEDFRCAMGVPLGSYVRVLLFVDKIMTNWFLDGERTFVRTLHFKIGVIGYESQTVIIRQFGNVKLLFVAIVLDLCISAYGMLGRYGTGRMNAKCWRLWPILVQLLWMPYARLTFCTFYDARLAFGSSQQCAPS